MGDFREIRRSRIHHRRTVDLYSDLLKIGELCHADGLLVVPATSLASSY